MLYPVADILGARLTLTDRGFTGAMSKEMKLGDWSVNFGGPIHSVNFTSECVSATMKLRKNLHLYLCVTNQGYNVNAILFDGTKVDGLKDGVVPGSPKKVFEAVTKAAVKFLKFDKPSSKWKPINAFNLD
jgi:hypothetical protein